MQLTTSFVLLALVALRSVGAAPTPFARSTSEIIDARDLDFPELQTREYSQVAFHIARDFNDWEDLDVRADPPATPTTTLPVQSATVNGKPTLPPLSIPGATVKTPGANPLLTPPATPNSANTPTTPAPLKSSQKAPLSPPMSPLSGSTTPRTAGMSPNPYGHFNHHGHGMQSYHGFFGMGSAYGRLRDVHHLEHEHRHDLAVLKKLQAENKSLKLTRKQYKALAKEKRDEAKAKRKAKQEAVKQARQEKRKAKKEAAKQAREEKKAAKRKATEEKKEANKQAKQDKKKAERTEKKAAIKDAQKKYKEARQELHDLKHPLSSSPSTKPATQPSSSLTPTTKSAGVVRAAVVPPVANANAKSTSSSSPTSSKPAAAPKANAPAGTAGRPTRVGK